MKNKLFKVTMKIRGAWSVKQGRIPEFEKDFYVVSTSEEAACWQAGYAYARTWHEGYQTGGYDGEIISKGVEEINVLTSEKVFVIVHPDSRVKHYWNARTKTWTPFADSATPLLSQKALDSAPSYGVVEEKLN